MRQNSNDPFVYIIILIAAILISREPFGWYSRRRKEITDSSDERSSESGKRMNNSLRRVPEEILPKAIMTPAPRW
jgi:hypothetical protein